MELKTRQLNFDEMFFKKPIMLHVPPAINNNPGNNELLNPGGQLANSSPIKVMPPEDLSNPVFPEFSGWEKTLKFLGKNWPWVLLGTGAIIVIGKVLYDKSQKNKKKGSEPANLSSQPQQVDSNS